MINIATCQYHIQQPSTWEQFSNKILGLIKEARQTKAQLLLLPEYTGIEVCPIQVENDEQLFVNIQSHLSNYLSFFQELAAEYKIYIQPGTILTKSLSNRFFNRAYFFGPSGKYGYQDKLQLVQEENEKNLIDSGLQQTVFETQNGLIGIAVCYDSEFPEQVRNLTSHGVKLLLVPSYTPSNASFLRVYHSCIARAIENQCYVVTASAIGDTNFGGTLENLTGQANIFTPIDVGFSEGILSQGPLNQSTIIYGTLDFQKISTVRSKGDVHNFNDYMRYDEMYPKSSMKIEKVIL